MLVMLVTLSMSRTVEGSVHKKKKKKMCLHALLLDKCLVSVD